MGRKLVAIALIDLVVLGVAYALEGRQGVTTAIISWAIAAIGLITFFGAVAAADNATKVTTRFALTASFAAVWFASVGALLFYRGEAGPLTPDAFQAISFVMSVVVVFYFGAQAYQAVGEAKAKAGTSIATPASAADGSASAVRDVLD